MSLFTTARKEQLKARVALCGPTGAGKTWTALQWATVLGGRIVVIDTENRSASYYADRYTFDVYDFQPPYEPGRLVDILRAAEHEDYDVAIIDSLSHFWEGEGGTLDIADNAGQRSGGNSFAGWKVATPALRHLVDAIRNSRIHVLATMRSKMEYVLEKDERSGKTTPKRVGMSPVMRAGVEYEFTVVGDLDLEHRLVISKSRCEQIADKVAQPGRAAEIAELFRTWLDSGVAPAPTPPPAETAAVSDPPGPLYATEAQVKKLQTIYSTLEVDSDARKEASRRILGLDTLTTHKNLTRDQASTIIELLTRVEDGRAQFARDDDGHVVAVEVLNGQGTVA